LAGATHRVIRTRLLRSTAVSEPAELDVVYAKIPPPAPTWPQTYKVVKGDSLAKIAKAFYGNDKNWVKIYKANERKIEDADAILPGLELTISAP
jgi:nucleoid-associated protein YgaU